MASVRVGVLRGGPSSEYEVSLKTGQSVLKHLPENKYQPVDILITKDGTWHIGGLPVTPDQALLRVDVFFNCLHGQYGEDGTVQKILDNLLVPYTGSGAFASALGMQKHQAKEYFRREGIKFPRHLLVCFGDDVLTKTRDIFNTMGPPWVVKPADRGSLIGMSKVKLLQDLPAAIERAFDFSPNILVEEFIRGKEVSCGILENFDNQAHRVFMPTAGDLTDLEASQVKQLAIKAHQALGLRHYSVADFVVSPRGVYLLEVNTLPKLHDEALLPKAARAENLAFPDLLDHLLTLVLSKA